MKNIRLKTNTDTKFSENATRLTSGVFRITGHQNETFDSIHNKS